MRSQDSNRRPRPFVVGRTARLFSDTVARTNLYALLQTCVVNGVDGYRHLSGMLSAPPKAR